MPTPQSKAVAKTAKNQGHKWAKGQSGNPAGRPKGSRQFLSEMFLKDFLNSWKKNGKKVLTKVVKEHPEAYLKIAASILPQKLDVELTEGLQITGFKMILPPQRKAANDR